MKREFFSPRKRGKKTSAELGDLTLFYYNKAPVDHFTAIGYSDEIAARSEPGDV